MATSKLQVYARLARGSTILGYIVARAPVYVHVHTRTLVNRASRCILRVATHVRTYAGACVRARARASSTLWNVGRRIRACTLRIRFPRCDTCPRAPSSGSGKTAVSFLAIFFLSLPFHYACTHKEPFNWILFGIGAWSESNVLLLHLSYLRVFNTFIRANKKISCVIYLDLFIVKY